MAVNKVVFGDRTVVDLTGDSVTADTMLEGVTAHDKSGAQITGTAVIPTVNNGKLTIQKNGTTVATFTANQSSAATANITVPVKVSELTNDSNFVADSPTFTEASSRANIASGETFATILGKIKKFFTDLKTVAFTGSYNDLSNKPTIPTVNNATLTIQKNGTTVKTFTANASSNVTADITVPTNVSELTNDSGYVTTDTKNTAGSTNTSSKIFLVGATSQAANPQTYSHDTAYVGTDGCLYSGGTKVLTAHQDISGKVNKSGDTMTGNLTIQRTSTNEQNSPATLNLWTVDSTNSVTSKGAISAYDGGASGANMVITPNGNLFVGSGEGPYNHYSLYKHSTGEVLYMTSDNQVHIQANGQTIANRLGLMIDNSGNVLPDKADVATNNSGSIGTSNYKWANGYFTNINGVAVGDSPKFTDTNNSVTQTNTTASADYRVLLSNNANDTTETTTARKSTNLIFNPSTGMLKSKSGFYSHYVHGGGGTSGYFRFLRITITGTYTDSPIIMSITHRSRTEGIFTIRFAGGNTTDPNISICYHRGADLPLYYIKADTSIWDFYVQKSSSYDACAVSMLNPAQVARGGMTLTWVDETVTELPTGYSTSTVETQVLDITGNAATVNNLTVQTAVPANAKFTDTDTKNTAGSTNTSSKIFLIGATSQAANPQTYSQDTAYVGTDGCLYSGGTKVLTAHQSIAGKVDKKTTLDTYYGTCSTAAATAAKVITVTDDATNFSLRAGITIVVKFSATNTAQNPTFNVNSTGAKKVWYNTALITTSSLGYAGTANRPMQFTYDGTQWVFVGWSYDANTTYSAMSVSELTTGTATTSRVVRADYLNTGIKAIALPLSGGVMTGPINLHNEGSLINSSGAASSATTFVKGSAFLNLCSPGIQCRNFADNGWAGITGTSFTPQNNSSRKIKENIKPITEEEAQKLLEVNVVSFDYKQGAGFGDGDERKGKFGVIAEEINEIIPSVVSYQINDDHTIDYNIPSGVSYDKFVPHLIKMIQIQQKEIDDLKKQVDYLFNSK